MTEMEVRRENRIRKCDVTTDNSGFNLLLERQDLGRVATRLERKDTREKRKTKKTTGKPSTHMEPRSEHNVLDKARLSLYAIAAAFGEPRNVRSCLHVICAFDVVFDLFDHCWMCQQ
jgi:hypothetical protein